MFLAGYLLGLIVGALIVLVPQYLADKYPPDDGMRPA